MSITYSTTKDYVVYTVANEFVGASEIPDEDDLKQTAIQYGRMKDVNGYKVELLQSSSTTTSIYKLVIGVLDLNDSIDFYTKVLQMKLLRKRSNVNNVPKSASMCAYCVSPYVLSCLASYSTYCTSLCSCYYRATRMRQMVRSSSWCIRMPPTESMSAQASTR
jgi:hypothetical protein